MVTGVKCLSELQVDNEGKSELYYVCMIVERMGEDKQNKKTLLAKYFTECERVLLYQSLESVPLTGDIEDIIIIKVCS